MGTGIQASEMATDPAHAQNVPRRGSADSEPAEAMPVPIASQSISLPPARRSLRSALFNHDNDYGTDPTATALRLPPLSVSCVVPYYETGALAIECAARLAHGLGRYRRAHPHAPRTQLVVVDDGSVANPFPLSMIPELQLIRLPQNRGRSVARNVGLGASTGFDVTLFVDSDVLVPEDLVLRTVELWDAGGADLRPRPAVVAGLFSTLRTDPDADLDRVLTDASVHTDWRWACRFQPSWVLTASDWIYAGRRFRLVADTGFFRRWSGMQGPWCLPNMVLGGCFAVPTAAAQDLGGFAESFAAYGFTETSLVARLVASGIPVIPQVKSAAVHVEANPAHHHQTDRNRLLAVAHRKFFTELLAP
ncbi:glycosyltransferase family 2 protein [Nocardia sp. XZ_19_369]|uniref:glycosyltransferase family 2 protein n=1 Tax=Nocardia sp. XZ_19_369 TaxID=2769487 RepID=UPI001890788D|nr:glycosyltransferase [Nocardia sp. XZ_19_369]